MTQKSLYSPYAAAKIVSELLGKSVAPQQLYGAVRNGKLKSCGRTETNKILVSEEDVREYVENILKAQAEREEKKARKSLQETANEIEA